MNSDVHPQAGQIATFTGAIARAFCRRSPAFGGGSISNMPEELKLTDFENYAIKPRAANCNSVG